MRKISRTYQIEAAVRVRGKRTKSVVGPIPSGLLASCWTRKELGNYRYHVHKKEDEEEEEEEKEIRRRKKKEQSKLFFYFLLVIFYLFFIF